MKITIILVAMFFVTQLIGLAVINSYAPEIVEVIDLDTGNITNVTDYDLPYGLDPPKDITPKSSLTSIVIALAIAIALLFTLMHFNAETILRSWFFIVVALALAITLNAINPDYAYMALIAGVIAIPFAYIKIFKRNLLVHNLTELLIYPGIASIFIPLLNVLTTVILLILISFYDMYAVWKSGFMQRMAQYQIKTLKVFSGFFVPYTRGKKPVKESKKSKGKKQKVSVAILGGGDVVFPIILAGVVFHVFGLLSALIISVGATIALAGLLYASEKGKFYPAMPFISAGCFAALGLVYLIN